VGRLSYGTLFGESADGLVTIESKHWHGYREHNEQDRAGLYANAGWQFGDDWSTRFYLTAIDFKQERINVSGTYVPLYGINGALGAFPIIGELLVSRSGDGLFGITFAVKGPTSKPDVLVNPMSMVAPGFLRQLFEFDQNDTGSSGPQRPNNSRPGNGRSSSLPQPPAR
jgi:hypothetical protein